MTRQALWARLQAAPSFDLAVVGGGATGLGVALDAAARGFSVLLVEAHDFAKGTSSRATKLVHGGVRYLAQGHISLVREALRERANLLRNAPHLVSPLPFVMPAYRWWQKPVYGAGLMAYDALAQGHCLGRTEFLDAAQTQTLLPTVQTTGLRGGVKYWDAQFDDARLALALARTAAAHGALLLNYCEAVGLMHDGGKISGLHLRERETGQALAVRTRCVVNATGVWADGLRLQDGAANAHPVRRVVTASQGVHLVVERSFLPTGHALLVPSTADGRVLFAVPWLGKVLLGTTDTPRQDLPLEPMAFREEVDFILREAGRVLVGQPGRADVTSVWTGLRPLVKSAGHEGGTSTGNLSREHTVLSSPSGLVSVTGGKWTTYRAMAEDVLASCAAAGVLPQRPGGGTAQLPLAGAQPSSLKVSDAPGLHGYGSDAAAVLALPGAQKLLGGGLTEAMVRFAARHEYARTVEDVLARRSRLLFLDAKLAAAAADAVNLILIQEIGAQAGADPQLGAFLRLAQQYQLQPEGSI